MKPVSFKARDRLQRSARSLVLVTLLALLCATTPVAMQLQAGAVDSAFTFGPGWVTIYDVTLQNDGKPLVGGTFTSFQASEIRNLVRLDSNGLVDPTFNTPLLTQYGGAANGIVFTVVAQRDGKVLVGGSFDSAGFLARTNLIRLNGDGSIDSAFDLSTSSNGVIWTLAPQDDGRTYVGGIFSRLGMADRPGLARLNSDASLDPAFAPEFSPYLNANVHALIVQSDGKILVGGSFKLPGTPMNSYVGVLRLDESGTLDPSFIPPAMPDHAGRVRALAIQHDGKIVVAGSFASIGGAARQSIARLENSGLVDETWAGPGVSSPQQSVHSIHAMLAVGSEKLLIAGDFRSYNGETAPGIARLNPDGTRDTTFHSPVDTVFSANAMTMQADGGILVGGSIQVGAMGTTLVRLTADDSRPTLTFSLQPGGVLRFAVPAGFNLQKILNLGDAWGDVSGSTSIDVPMSDPRGFFQLKQ